MKKIVSILLILFGMTFLYACKEEIEFKFNEKSITVNIGEEKEINYKKVEGKEVSFTPSEEGIVSIEGNKVTGLSLGEVTISGSFKGSSKKDEMTVKVVKETVVQAESIEIHGKETLALGEETILTATIYPENTTNKSVTWLSSDVDIATIDSEGKVTSLKEGVVTMSAKVDEVEKNHVITIKAGAIDVESVTIVGENEVFTGNSIFLTANITPSNATNKTVIWTSSDDFIATIDSQGRLTGVSEGTVTITAKVDGKVDTIDVLVKETTLSNNYVDFYYLNDLHGAIEKSGSNLGMAYIANFIEQRKKENPHLILLGGGDMFQGSALSNHYQGLSTLTLMNLMGFDAMAIGNHEFDWGLTTVSDYFGGNTPKATFPLLGINVIEKSTGERPDNIEPYVMIERGGIKVGVIGVMGEDLESSIAYNMVKDYEFVPSLNLIRDATKTLRNQGADIVAVIVHDYDTSLNNAITQMEISSMDEKVDVVFNAHYHLNIVDVVNNKPIIQSGSSGQMVGHVRIYLDGRYEHENIKYHEDFNTTSSIVQNQIEIYKAETDALFYELIIKNQDYLSRNSLSYWLARLMKAKTGADIAFHNYGGTRRDLDFNEDINLAVLYEIWPFDNVVKTVKLKGSVIKQLMSEEALLYSTDVSIEDHKEYLLATNDYVFDYEENQIYFSQGTDHTNTGIVLRDMVKEELIRQSSLFDYFKTTNPIQTVIMSNEIQYSLFL